MDNKRIEFVNSTRFLGIKIQNRLDWKIRTDTVVNKLSKGMYVLQQLCQSVDWRQYK